MAQLTVFIPNTDDLDERAEHLTNIVALVRDGYTSGEVGNYGYWHYDEDAHPVSNGAV